MKQPHRLVWPDVVRLLATAAIFTFHFSGDFARLGGESGSRGAVFIAAHFASWGIAAFVVLGGFAPALSCFVAAPTYRAYAAKRLVRILAPYWTVALPFIVAGFVVGEGVLADAWKIPVWLAGLGPVSPQTYRPISEAWWYVSLALQISLIVPLLVRSYRRLGPLPTTFGVLAVNAVTLVLIGLAGKRWEYLAQGLVLARLGEVLVGVLAASIVVKRRTVGSTVRGELLSMALVMASMPLLCSMERFTAWTTVVALGVVFLVCAMWVSTTGRTNRWTLSANIT